MDHEEAKPAALPDSGETPTDRRTGHRLRLFGGRSVPLPASQIVRIGLGIGLLAGGLLWFLPVLGIWMLPLGLAVLSVDVPIVRRWTRRSSVALHRRYPVMMGRIFPSSRNGANSSRRR